MRRVCSVDGCGRFRKGYGLCEMHLRRKVKHGDVGPMGRILTKQGEPQEWLLQHVEYDGEDCLIWPYATMTNGYPLTWWFGKKAGGHRVMCELVNGPSPSPIHEAAHSCGNGAIGCIHPKHLRWATPLENNREKIVHGTMIMGSRISWSKLTEENVRLIRKRFGKESDIEIADKFGVSDSTIYSIRHGRSWKHVQ